MGTRILLFDDDEAYGKIAQMFGRKMGLTVIHCSEMEDFCLKALEDDFDCVLIDYNLGDFKGDEVARVIEGKPTFLISCDQSLDASSPSWGDAVHGFFSKETRISQVLAEASMSVPVN